MTTTGEGDAPYQNVPPEVVEALKGLKETWLRCGLDWLRNGHGQTDRHYQLLSELVES